jgi:monothiol glutaredoxin
MADDVTHDIENEIRNNKIMIYMKGNPTFPQCGFSAATMEVFQEIGKPFHTVDVLSEPAKRDAIKRYSNWPTIPQVYIGGKFVGGCDIVREMFHTGELQKLVDDTFAAS